MSRPIESHIAAWITIPIFLVAFLSMAHDCAYSPPGPDQQQRIGGAP